MTDDPQQAIAAHKSAVSGSVGRAAVEAWQREREEACRSRHATAPDRIPARVCTVCYLPLPPVPDPLLALKTRTHADPCAAALRAVDAMDYGRACEWCNRWVRPDPAALLPLPYCSSACFAAAPGELSDAPRSWPATRYLPPPPLTVGARQRAARVDACTVVTWPAADAPLPAWLRYGRFPESAAVPPVTVTEALQALAAAIPRPARVRITAVQAHLATAGRPLETRQVAGMLREAGHYVYKARGVAWVRVADNFPVPQDPSAPAVTALAPLRIATSATIPTPSAQSPENTAEREVGITDARESRATPFPDGRPAVVAPMPPCGPPPSMTSDDSRLLSQRGDPQVGPGSAGLRHVDGANLETPVQPLR